jgi:ABC-type nitrate/sulfonate/bicarbonate transport system permease component
MHVVRSFSHPLRKNWSSQGSVAVVVHVAVVAPVVAHVHAAVVVAAPVVDGVVDPVDGVVDPVDVAVFPVAVEVLWNDSDPTAFFLSFFLSFFVLTAAHRYTQRASREQQNSSF